MIKVTLVDCKGSRNEGRKRMENLGLGYLAAVLEKKGYQVEIIDANYFDFILTGLSHASSNNNLWWLDFLSSSIMRRKRLP